MPAPTTSRSTRPVTRTQPKPRTAGLRRVKRETKKSNALMYSVIGFIVVALIGGGIRLLVKADDSGDVRQKMHELAKQSAAYSANAAYIDGRIDEHHSEVFNHTYSMGGRHSSAKFNAEAYVHEMAGVIAEDAKRDGKAEVAKEFADY